MVEKWGLFFSIMFTVMPLPFTIQKDFIKLLGKQWQAFIFPPKLAQGVNERNPLSG